MRLFGAVMIESGSKWNPNGQKASQIRKTGVAHRKVKTALIYLAIPPGWSGV
jgi:hypothetical protein